MKNLLKSVICGSINSARKHCSWKTWSTTAAWKEKKKGKHRKKKRGRANRNPNTYKSFGSKLPQMSKGVKIGDQTAKTFPHQLIRIYPFNLQ